MYVRHLLLHAKSPQHLVTETTHVDCVTVSVGRELDVAQVGISASGSPTGLQTVLAGAAASSEGSPWGECPSSSRVWLWTRFSSSQAGRRPKLLAGCHQKPPSVPSTGSLCWAAADPSQSQG